VSRELAEALVACAVIAGAFFIAVAIIELMRELKRAEVTTTNMDVAAQQIFEVIREATEIAREAVDGQSG
jgi:hypothetical protein